MKKTINGILLVAGTAIGGGMLALPVLTAAGGFFPSIVIYFLCWLFMAATGLLLVEVFFWQNKENANIISMAEMTLGKWGKIAAWALYLFFFYSLTVAYIAGGGNLMNDLLASIFKQTPALCGGPLLFVILFAPFVAISAKVTSRINSILMFGLIFSFFIFVFLGTPHVEAHFLKNHSINLALLATPVAFAAFGFQGIVPTLTNYLDRDARKTARVIVIGTLIPFLIYVIWEWLILGVVPPEGLEEALKMGQSAVFPLKKVLHVPWLYTVGQFFAFFAIVTSFLGVTLGLLDFLSDGLKVEKNFRGRTLLALLVFLPPLVFSMIKPSIFLDALRYAGGIGSALLLGLLPILMAYRGRYILKLKSERLVPGGKKLFFALLLFVAFELFIVALCIKG